MQEEEYEDQYRYEEWTIENFSCWNGEIHDRSIKTSKTDMDNEFIVSLYPRGENLQREYILLILNSSNPVAFSGEVSFIGPDGSQLYTQPIYSGNDETKEVFLLGPKYEEVVSAIKRAEDVHGDRLIVRYRLKGLFDCKEFRKTTIEVFNAALRIIPLELIPELFPFGTLISLLRYPVGEEMIGRLELSFSKNDYDCERLEFSLLPIGLESNVLVRTRLSVPSNDNAVMKTEDNEHLFRSDQIWFFSRSLKVEEMRKKDSSFTLHFKIIPQKKMKQSASVLYYFEESVTFISTEN